MNTFALLLPVLIGAMLITYLVGKPYWREYQRQKVKQKPFPKEWRKIIQRQLPYFQKMPVDLQLQLKEHIQVFLAEKKFIGCNGVEINDEIKVTIAAQACLLLLNRKTDYYPKLQSILVYPRAFFKEQHIRSAEGVEYAQKMVLTGESWDYGKVVLSWEDTLLGARDPHDGHNVVIHEFAHQLDQENGQANGAPILGKNQTYQSWSSAFTAQYDRLKHQVATGSPSLFDYYGATNPAEFFAVATEVFFEQAERFSREHPTLYQQMRLYYHVDPVHWW